MFFGGVGLVVDQCGDFCELVQFVLYFVYFVVVIDWYVGSQVVYILVFVWVIVDYYDLLYVFSGELVGNLWYGQCVVYWLVVGYSYCVVVENFVGD